MSDLRAARSQAASATARRMDLTASDIDRGLAQLVLAVLDLLRQVMERQVLRRMDGGSLGPEETERVGAALKALERRVGELQSAFERRSTDLEWLEDALSARSGVSKDVRRYP